MSDYPQRQLFHHRCQELLRRGQRQVVGISNVVWDEQHVELPDPQSIRVELAFREGSLQHRQGGEQVGSKLSPWSPAHIHVTSSLGKRPHAQWSPGGPPTIHRALAASLLADLAIAWLRPIEFEDASQWSPPAPRDVARYFSKFEEKLESKKSSQGYEVHTHFSFSHREPPGSERGDSLEAKGLATTLFDQHGCIVEAESKALYFRYGREVGVDSFRLGLKPKPFSWS